MDKSRLLLLLRGGENKRLLINKLSPKFDIVLPTEGSPPLTEITKDAFDLAIFDLVSLGHWQLALNEWRQNAEPLILPMIALLPKHAINTLPLETRYQIDDVVTLPVDPVELDVRISVLLRSRRLSIKLQEKNQRLEELNTLKSRFVSVVSHEFRSPLSVVSGIAQLLERREQHLSSEKKQDLFKRLSRVVAKLTNLLDELLVLSRNESDQATFEPASVNITEHCQSLVSNLTLSRQKDSNEVQQIVLNLQRDVSVAFIDVSLTDTILTNLLSNAIKYSPASSVVTLSLQQTDQRIIFEVTDKGRGIPPEDQPALFDTFFRARNVGATPGTGLGLSIVKQCVDLHQGTIAVHSEVNQGTTFTVSLPSVEPSGAQPSGAQL